MIALIGSDTSGSYGTSETAHFITNQLLEGRQKLGESYVYGLDIKAVFEDLLDVFKECRDSNWDAYGAVRISEDVVDLTCQLLEVLPLGTPSPSFGAEPDGHLTLEWHRSPRQTLSVSISPKGELHYAALLGASKAYGTVPFFGEVPMEIVELIRRVMAE